MGFSGFYGLNVLLNFKSWKLNPQIDMLIWDGTSRMQLRLGKANKVITSVYLQRKEERTELPAFFISPRDRGCHTMMHQDGPHWRLMPYT
jgi:hypothetical protein